jgi:glycosyltransferase involved in cell wall biosynthesis
MAYQKVADAADQVFTNSHLLAEFMQAKGARVKPVPNGVDWERFHQTLANKPAEPLELAAIPHPRIGFVGILSSVTDHTLLDRVAEEVPEAQVVLIGSAIGKAEPLHSRIHQFGMKSYEEIPDYLAGLDAGLLIYRLCEGTLYNDPLKTYEYLAAGLPVVATNAQEHLRKLAHVQMANNANEFVSTVRRLVAEKTSPAEAEARSQSVRMHDWKYRSQEMLDTLSRAPTKPIV